MSLALSKWLYSTLIIKKFIIDFEYFNDNSI